MSKRIMKSAVNWKELEKRVPPEEINKFRVFKAKSELYLRRMLTNPPDPPPINWEAYKKTVPVPGLVDKFKSEYESFKVPYPADKMTALVDKQWAELEPQIKQYSDEMKTHILSAEKEIARINALPKYEETTMEMVRDMFPDDALDPVNKPSFWPHSADEQLGYKDPTQKIDSCQYGSSKTEDIEEKKNNSKNTKKGKKTTKETHEENKKRTIKPKSTENKEQSCL